MRNVFILSNTSPHLGSVAVDYTRKPDKLLWNISISDVSKKGFQFVCRPLVYSLRLKNFLKCTVEGKLLYTPSLANLNIWFSGAFSPHWEEKQSWKESHNDTVLGMHSQVNWIMEFFQWRLTWPYTVCFQLLLFALDVDQSFIILEGGAL